MQFDYISQPIDAASTDGPMFTLERVWIREGATNREVSHLLDRTFPYGSPRQLQWHLADRFGLSVRTVVVTHH